MAADETPGPGTLAPRSWHLDQGDNLALLHRATQHDAERQQEVLRIATEIARRTTLGPWSVPHLAVHRDGSLGRALGWGGGPERAMIDDQMPSYLVVDALLMKRACERPRETDLIRRRMITDARQPTGMEITFANQTATLLGQYRGAVAASSRTARDIEMADDALQLYNLRQRGLTERFASRGSAQMGLTETQFIAEPDLGPRNVSKATPREAAVPSGTMRYAMRATQRAVLSDSAVAMSRGARFTRGDMSDRIAPPSDGMRRVGSSRMGRPEPSHARMRDESMTPALDI
jgi:hypothetical protein